MTSEDVRKILDIMFEWLDDSVCYDDKAALRDRLTAAGYGEEGGWASVRTSI